MTGVNESVNILRLAGSEECGTDQPEPPNDTEVVVSIACTAAQTQGGLAVRERQTGEEVTLGGKSQLADEEGFEGLRGQETQL